MNQNIWGPSVWVLLHTMTLAYPLKPTKEQMDNQLMFLKSFANVIPCDICKVHYTRNLDENPPRLENRKQFFEWIVDLHNEVNGRTGKRSYSYDEVLKLYNEKYQKNYLLDSDADIDDNWKVCCRKLYCCWMRYHAYVIILILLVIIYYLYVKGAKLKK